MTMIEAVQQDGAQEKLATDDVELAQRMSDAAARVRSELGRRIIGQQDVIEQMLLTLFVGGNSLIIGVPGLAKTLLVHSLAQALSLKFSRIQFTPDLMPSDITGTDILQEDPDGRRTMTFAPGPIFANVVLADEINRTPPKTQSALLEAMQEHRVTVQGRTYTLAEPFHVFATQNPIELEGTYPLPEAQLDRFMFQIVIDHMPEADELAVVRTTTATQGGDLQPVMTGDELLAYQALVRRVPVSDAVLQYAVTLVRRTRPGEDAPAAVREWVGYGASVRAAQYLALGGKARALLQGRTHVAFEDIRALAHAVLRHRVLLNFHAQSERITTEQVVQNLLDAVKPPASGMK